MSEFRELRIRITSDKVTFTGVNEQSHEGKPNFGVEMLEKLRGLRAEGASKEYGTELFRATFTEGLEDGYRSAQQEIDQLRARWRVRLEIPKDERELHTLWWECLSDDTQMKKPLATRGGTLISRFLSGGAVAPALPSQGLRMLVVIANPSDLGQGKWAGVPRLDEELETGIIQRALSGLEGVLDYEVLTQNASLSSIRQRLRDDGVNVLHIVAHGGFVEGADGGPGKGVLLLENDDEETAAAEDEERLALLVDDLPGLRLVVLSACQSATRSSVDPFIGLAPTMLYSGVDAVVAMQDTIGQDMARIFSEHFYRSLFTSREANGMVDAAMTIARDELFFKTTQGGWDWAIPVLFMRGEGQLASPEAPARHRETSQEASAPAAPAPVEEASAPVQPLRATDFREARAPSSSKEIVLTGDQRGFLLDQLRALPEDELEALCYVLDIPSGELEGTPLNRAMELLKRAEREAKVDRLADRLTAAKALRAIQEQQADMVMLRDLTGRATRGGVAS